MPLYRLFPLQVLEGVDIIAARVNLAQAFALGCLADSSLTDSDTCNATPTEAPAGIVSGLLDEYFSGAKLYAPPDQEIKGFLYAYSKVKAVKEIFALYYQLQQLRSVVKNAAKAVSEEAAEMGDHGHSRGSDLDKVRVQLLASNVDYALQHLHSLCNKLYAKLLQTV